MMRRVSLQDASTTHYDLCVVGAGAAGLSLAHAVRLAGRSVIVVERGGESDAPDPAQAEIAETVPHDPLHRTNFQGLGGTLNRWGRRCVPFDRVDFDERPANKPGWPITYEEFCKWLPDACGFLGIENDFTLGPPPGWGALGNVRVDTVERLSPDDILVPFKRRKRDGSLVPDLLLHASALGLKWSGRRVQGVRVASGGERISIRADDVVLACGGLHCTRLLLSEEIQNPGRFTGHRQIGQSYMGHLTGSIATIRFASAADVSAFAYNAIASRSAARRRFLITTRQGASVAIWVENLPKDDPRHNSGELSFKALAPGAVSNPRDHVRNLLRDPVGIGQGVFAALSKRIHPKRSHPNRLIARGPGPYRLAYHAEHLPNPASRVSLAPSTDEDGLPRLRIEFDYDNDTLEAVVAAHQTLANALSIAQLAQVELTDGPGSLVEIVKKQARDGYHQIGLTRMSDSPEDGVVDRDARVHGTENLYVASASVFPVAGQANPTLSVVALALRLADALSKKRSQKNVA